MRAYEATAAAAQQVHLHSQVRRRRVNKSEARADNGESCDVRVEIVERVWGLATANETSGRRCRVTATALESTG